MTRTVASLRWKTAAIFALLPLLVVGVAGAAYAPPASVDLSVYPWLYRRDGRSPPTGPEVVEVVLVGDVLLGRGVPGEDPLRAVSPWLRKADLAMGNLEGVLAMEEDFLSPPAGDPGMGIRLLMPPRAAGELAAAGFDLLGLANNHSMDYGEVGLRQTIDQLAVSGLSTVGAGADQNQAWTPVYIRIRGVELAFLGLNAVPVPGEARTGWAPARWDPDRVARAVAAAAGQADAVIVSIHWGYEYQQVADPHQRALAEALLAAGADLVVGHHPHVVQGTRITPEGGFVAYSLGNFVFDQYQEATRAGLALRALFDEDGLRAVQALPVQAGPRPALMPMETAGDLLAQIEPETWREGAPGAGGAWRRIEVPPTGPAGGFATGSIDLTGDGTAEQVRLHRGQVTVEAGGAVVWESPAAWEVLDVALGDPNDDGRYEILLALNKPAENGELRSHPFIIGYRGGRYQTVWGGSAVSDPILEVELLDVDGDRAAELIVLEAAGNGEGTAVSVWDWHGWGFSQIWRGPVGFYRDLRVRPAPDPVISVEVRR